MIAAALGWAAGAHALPAFTASNEGDWFDGASWSAGTAPSPGDDPLVDNGGTAVADGTSVEVQSLAVGSRLDPARPADASGAVELTDADLALVGNLSVGVVDLDPGNTASSVSGSLSVAAGDQASGNVTAAETRVGVVSRGPLGSGFGPDGSDATGALAVAGDLDAKTFLEVGASDLVGTAAGQLTVGGDVRLRSEPLNARNGFGTVKVGTSAALVGEPHPTPATGSLSVAGDLHFVHEGDVKQSSLLVGSATRAHAEGDAEIGGDVTGFVGVDVGVAHADFGSLGTEGVATARGELDVAGKLELFSNGRLGIRSILRVGVSDGGILEGASAQGHAAIGEIGNVNLVLVGRSASGPATGVLEIGAGNAGSADVGVAWGDGAATGSLATGGSLAEVRVGSSGSPTIPSDPISAGTAIGSAIVGGSVGLAVVGEVNSDGSATGYLDVGSVTDGLVRVGYSEVGAGTADGRMIVRSGGIGASQVQVGSLGFPLASPSIVANAEVSGFLESTGDTSTQLFLGDTVGYANASATGHADGTWILHEGTYTGRKLRVGVSEGAGTATGLLHLDRTLVDVDDITLGDGATVELEIQGPLRGSQYSAFDADVMRLDGALEVAFTEPAQLGVYDLIVSAALDGIFGDFDSVSVEGLDAGQLAFWGIETTGGASPVEVFRLHVVPEPTPGVLVALGLFALGIRAHRARAAR